jgi:VacB/RNase II family 3'-5' exoribonuclease
VLSPRIKLESPSTLLREGFARIRARMRLPTEFPAQVLSEAREAAARVPDRTPARKDRLELDLVTIDPEGSKDLDQAFYAAAGESGFRIHYAIADLGHFIDPGSELETESQVRGRTLYCPDARIPLYPQVLSEGAASLLPGQVRPAILWTLDLDLEGRVGSTAVERAIVKSRRQMTYRQAQKELDSGKASSSLRVLREVGVLRERVEQARGGVDLRIPEQEVHGGRGGFELVYRSHLSVEGWNAQISLMTGMAAAELMLTHGMGLLRTLPAPSQETVDTLRRSAVGLGLTWPPGQSYQEFIRSLDPGEPHQAAMLALCRSLFRGVAYKFFDRKTPDNPYHHALAAPYAHVTAPLRRMADRLNNELVVELFRGNRPANWLLERLAEAPEIMKKADQADRELQSRIVDFVEAVFLQGRVGAQFDAVVIEAGEKVGLVQLKDPAVVGPCDGAGLPLGEQIAVTLTEADPINGRIRFARSH